MAAVVAITAALVAVFIRAKHHDPAVAAKPVLSPSPDHPVSAAGFAPTRSALTTPPGQAPAGMVWIPGGEFSMGSDDPTACGCRGNGHETMADARPIHRVAVDGFWMDATTVTNDQFAAFVAATGYVTVGERPLDPAEFPALPPQALVAGGLVFTPTPHPVPLGDWQGWWRYVPGACWRHPHGPDSGIAGLGDLPVVQMAYADACAYAAWVGKRLPTEAEWEFAARGGLSGQRYAWGDGFQKDGRFMANTWQGSFPDADTGADGFAGIAAVGRFPANGYGLYDMSGNVWQWCSDWYRPDAYATRAAAGVAMNPSGPTSSSDPDEPGAQKRVQRGGSFLCTEQYCTRYMVGTRGKGEIATASDHVGFRCVIPGAGR